MKKFNNSYIIGWPWHRGNITKYNVFRNENIPKLIAKHDIKNYKNLLTSQKINILTKDIIEQLFVKKILKITIKNYDEILLECRNNRDPDFRIIKNKKVESFVEVYSPSYSKAVRDNLGKSKNGIITYGSQHNPLKTDTITEKINKYRSKYPEAKQCIFCFFHDVLNKKNIMRAFNNFYGDTIHSNGSLAHNTKDYLCKNENMTTVAGFFLVAGHLNIQKKTLEYRDLIFAHNPFCIEKYKLSFSYFNDNQVYQSYIEFLETKPTREKWWGNFLIRFYKNEYPDYLFIKENINYCKQAYPKIATSMI